MAFEKFANHLINLNDTFKNKEEAIALMKARGKKFENLKQNKNVQNEILVINKILQGIQSLGGQMILFTIPPPFPALRSNAVVL